MIRIKQLAHLLEHSLARCAVFIHYIGGVALALMAVIVFYGVVMRYLFKAPEIFSQEISAYLLLAGSALALAHIQKIDHNIKVDFIVNHFPKNVRGFIFNFLGPMIGFIFAGTIVWQSWLFAWRYLKTGATTHTLLQIPLFPLWVLLPIGFGFLGLILMAQAIGFLFSSSNKVKDHRE